MRSLGEFADLLEANGFRPAGTCTCIGPKTYKFKRGDYVIYWNKKAKKYKVKKFNKAITLLISEDEIKKSIADFFPEEVQTSAPS